MTRVLGQQGAAVATRRPLALAATLLHRSARAYSRSCPKLQLRKCLALFLLLLLRLQQGLGHQLLRLPASLQPWQPAGLCLTLAAPRLSKPLHGSARG